MSASLFDYMARESDPDTSKAAATEDRSTLEMDVLSAIRSTGWVGCTTDEAWRLIGYKARQNSIARRITTLAKDGQIELAGQRPGDSGRMQNAWRVPSYMGEAA